MNLIIKDVKVLLFSVIVISPLFCHLFFPTICPVSFHSQEILAS